MVLLRIPSEASDFYFYKLGLVSFMKVPCHEIVRGLSRSVSSTIQAIISDWPVANPARLHHLDMMDCTSCSPI
jgi:hypothetical protein